MVPEPDQTPPDTQQLFVRPVSPASEVGRLLVVAREVLSGDFPEEAALGAWDILRGDPARVVQLLAARALPPAALEVVAGLAGIVRAKDHAMCPFWEACRPWIDPQDDPAEDERAEGTAGGSERPAVADEALLALGRVALIGAGGTFFTDAARVRPVLWSQRKLGAAWSGLYLALDAIAAGSFAGLDGLRALANAHPDSPAIVWLDEVAARLAHEDARAAARAQRLNSLLDTGAYGVNATELVGAVALGRRLFAEEGVRLHDAWLILTATARSVSSLPGPAIDDLPAPRRAAIRRAAREGNELAKLVQKIDEMLADAQKAEREAEEREGPFHGLDLLPSAVREPIETVMHYAVLGFRECYGLELLRDAIPPLTDWAREHGGAARAA
jgi:hypothetical protein